MCNRNTTESLDVSHGLYKWRVWFLFTYGIQVLVVNSVLTPHRCLPVFSQLWSIFTNTLRAALHLFCGGKVKEGSRHGFLSLQNYCYFPLSPNSSLEWILCDLFPLCKCLVRFLCKKIHRFQISAASECFILSYLFAPDLTRSGEILFRYSKKIVFTCAQLCSPQVSTYSHLLSCYSHQLSLDFLS